MDQKNSYSHTEVGCTKCYRPGVLFVVAALVAGMMTVMTTAAQARTETIYWSHSINNVAGFRMYSSPTSGHASSLLIQDISLAEVAQNSEGRFFQVIDVADEATVHITVTAYSDQNVESFRSNEKILAPPVISDRDGDGVPDGDDIFPDDATEWEDSDNDGVGNNLDHFDLDPTEWRDTDGDSYGDNGDAFPADATEWSDRDADGYGDNRDAFPDDPTRNVFDTVASPYRVNVGEAEDYEGLYGRMWTRDMGFFNTGVSNSIAADTPINSTFYDEIYRSGRTDPDGGDEMVFSFPVTNGSYTVRLHFAEHIYTESNQRVFDVDIEGTRVLSGFDIFAEGNGRFTAVVRNLTVEVTDGALDIRFGRRSGGSDPTIMGIEIVSQDAVEGEVLTTPGKPFVIEVN